MSKADYSLADVVGIVGLSRRDVQSLVKSGYVTPKRGARRQHRFSFQDIVVLKTANALLRGAVPRRRITTALAALRKQLPETVPLAGLRIRAMGSAIVVQEKSHTWNPVSGQGLLAFEVTPEAGDLRLVEPGTERDAGAARGVAAQQLEASVERWFEEALRLEEADVTGACARYRQIVAADAGYVSAYVNWGRLLHEQKDYDAAEKIYREAIDSCEACASLNYNLGVLLEDAGRTEEAILAYQQALLCDPDDRDSHYNLARLFEMTNRSQHAIRHFNRYRALSRTSRSPE